MDEIIRFCGMIRQRSQDHTEAMKRIHDLPAIMASILRQELDSMVRVIYLLTIQDLEDRRTLVNQSLNGQKWKVVRNGKNIDMTDREMVNASNKIHGWALSVYKFGCSFIHLSNFHDYGQQNPFNNLKEDEKSDILMHLRNYHGGPSSDNPSFMELASYFPSVFEKIKGNLECYLEDLESNSISEYL
jgi:hypothetical protein